MTNDPKEPEVVVYRGFRITIEELSKGEWCASITWKSNLNNNHGSVSKCGPCEEDVLSRAKKFLDVRAEKSSPNDYVDGSEDGWSPSGSFTKLVGK